MAMSLETESILRESQAATKTILLVEDDPYISSFLVEAIAQETPYRVIVASDSTAALKLVRHFTPCLFILDYSLPGMNGIELFDRFKLNQALATIPTILINASAFFWTLYLPSSFLMGKGSTKTGIS